MMENIFFKKLRILTILLAISLTAVSSVGAFLPDTYARDSPSMAAQGAGQDMVNLFLGVPLLLISFYSASKGNRKGLLLYGGVLAYIMYSYVIYAFGVHFNRFFLLYCSTLGLSLYAFIMFMRGVSHLELDRWFEGAPVKLISVFLVLVALIFYGLWLSTVLPATFGNNVPEEISNNDFLVNPIHVIDLTFALPALLIGAVQIWKRRALGYLIASLALVFMVLLTIALAAMMVMLVVREISEEYTVAVVFGVVSIISVWILILLFRKLDGPSS
jgi:hypothetical protein